MATSGSFDFTLQRNDLIKRSLLLLGVVSPAQTLTSEEISDASNVLNLMLKAWQADGLQLWQTTQVSVTPTVSTGSYTFGDGTWTSYQPTDILEAYRKETSTEVWVKLNRYSRRQFNQLSDHDSEGIPVNFYYNNGISQGTLEVWPIPDTSFATNYTLEVLLTKPFDDMDAAANTLAFPQYWELAVVYGLAMLLAPEYGVSLGDQKVLIAMADRFKKSAMDWDTEHTSLYFQPEYIHA